MYDTLEPREVVKAFNKCEGKAMKTSQYLNFVQNVKEPQSLQANI